MANRQSLSVKTFVNTAIISLLTNVLAGIFERKPFYKNHVLYSSLASFSTHKTSAICSQKKYFVLTCHEPFMDSS